MSHYDNKSPKDPNDSWYLEVAKGKWTCLACMDRKARDQEQVLRHEKSDGHTRHVAIRLQGIETSFPNMTSSTETEATIQGLLLALSNEQAETSEEDTSGMAGFISGERHEDTSALAASLLGRLNEDQGLDVEQMPHLELEERGHGDTDHGNAVPLKRVLSGSYEIENLWFPWPNKIACTLDVLMHLPRSTFSHRQLDVLFWLLRVNNISINIPSAKSIRNLEAQLQSVYGIRTLPYDGAFGNKFYVNSIADIISQEMANPHVRPHLHFYPEDSGVTVNEYYQAAHWRTEVAASKLTPMAVIDGYHYYVYEPCLLRNGRACVPVRWFIRNGQLFATAWVLRMMVDQHHHCWIAEEYNEIEVTHSDLLLPSTAWDSTPATTGMPRPTQLVGSLRTEDGEIQPWRYTDPNVGNTWRHIANGSRVYAFPLWLYCDDTSGNVSKRWNKHNSFLFSPAGLPRAHAHQEYNVHFLCTSNVAEPLEMLEGIVDQLEEPRMKGIWAWDHVHQEEVVVVPFVCALLGDNPMQSEFACHIGSKGKLFCRVCKVNNSTSMAACPPANPPTGPQIGSSNNPLTGPPTNPFTSPPTNPLTSSATDESPDLSAEDSDHESIPESVTSAGSTGATKVNKEETMQEMIDRITRFVSIDHPRDPFDTQESLQSMIVGSKVVGKKTKVGNLKTEKGIKDTYLDHFLNGMFNSYKRLQGKDARQRALDAYCGTLPATLISPVWRIEGINPHADTPIEILHTVLLGFIKYFWRDAINNQIGNKMEKKRLLEIRLSSVETSGLGISKLSGSTLVQYAGSLTGRDFRVIAQVAPFVLHGLVSSPCYEAWISLSNLVPIVWQPQIPDINVHLRRLRVAINNFIAHTVKWTPRWFNKPKFHYILHLEDHVRRFGPAVIFATEIFESHNAVIRSKSVHSNRQAPSHDIAIAFAHTNRLRAFLCGGRIRAHQPVPTLTPASSHPTPATGVPRWQPVATGPAELVNQRNIVTDYLGIKFGPDISQLGLAISDGSPPRQYTETKAGLHCPGGLRPPSTPMKFCTYSSVVLENGDTCFIGDWVLAQGDVTDSVVCRIEEILSPLSMDGQAPQHASAILLQRATLAETTTAYRMPKVCLQNEFFLQPTSGVFCAANLQHNCIAHKCGLMVRGFVRQERQATLVEEQGIHHIEPLDLVLNTAKMHDAVHLYQLRVQVHPEDINLSDAIFQGVKSEIDKRKDSRAPQGSLDAGQRNNAGTRGHRVSRHAARNRGSSGGRRQGRRGGNI